MDRRFKKWLKQRLGPELYQHLESDHRIEQLSSHTVEGGLMAEIMHGARGFEVVKRNFRGDHDAYIAFPVQFNPANQAQGSDSDELLITTREMSAFFDPSIEQILNLIREQVHLVARKISARTRVWMIRDLSCMGV